MLENRLFYLASLVGMLVFHCYYTGWISWFALLVVLLLPVFSLVFSLRPILRLRLGVQMPSSCAREEETHLLLTSGCDGGLLPVPLCRLRYVCEDVMAGESQTAQLKLVAWDSFAISLPTAHCGAFRCCIQKARVYDYLGLFSFSLRLPPPQTLLVMPKEAAPEPLPNLSQFRCRSYRPKHGGGFSELHDMREYRAGDSMRDIHWKLSAKTDRLIVREAQEPDRGQTLLTLDLCGSRTQLDHSFDVLCWLSRWLLQHEVRHNVSWLAPKTLEPESALITSEESLAALIEQLLQTQLRSAMPSIAARSYPNADWRYHIGGGTEEAAG